MEGTDAGHLQQNGVITVANGNNKIYWIDAKILEDLKPND